MEESGLKAPRQAFALSKYEGLSLFDLAELVADKGDREALAEFHERRCVLSDDGAEWMRVTDYVNLLLERALERRCRVYRVADEVLEKAYDLTVEKFHNLPQAPAEGIVKNGASRRKSERSQTDCRLYFKAFLSLAGDRLRGGEGMSALEMEVDAGRLLPRFLWRQFNFSLKEALRGANPLISRYYWEVGGRKICLWFPKRMSGRERRAWLEANIDGRGLHGAPDRGEIQKMIDQRLDMGGIVSMDEPAGEVALQRQEAKSRPESPLAGTALEELDQFVAQEKADTLSSLRPAIQKLGAKKLKAMILKIFGDLRNEEYNDGEIAKQFGLSKATFSRFAGSQWQKGSGREIPDLWANTSKVIAQRESFAEAALEAGFKTQMEAAQA